MAKVDLAYIKERVQCVAKECVEHAGGLIAWHNIHESQQDLNIQIYRIAKRMHDYLELKLVSEKPRVHKVGTSASFNWSFSRNHLFVLPIVYARARGLSERVSDIHAFKLTDPWNPNNTQLCWPRWCFDDVHMNGSFFHSREVIALVQEICGDRLDALQVELLRMRAEVGTRVDELVAEHIQKKSRKEAAKFREKFVKFLKSSPELINSDPDFILTCFRLDPLALEALQEFLKTSRSDLPFITRDDITDAQDVAKIVEVHDS